MAITKEYEVKINGSQSVRELKQEILDARTALKEMQGGTEEYNNAVRGLTEKELELIQIMKAQKGEGTALEGSYRAISEQMSALKKVYKELGDEATRNTMGQEINALNDQLKAMDYSQGNYQRNVGNYMGALKVLNAEYKNQREELRALKVAMESMEPSMEGYNEMFMRAAEITHNMTDQTESLKYASPDLGDQLSNINGIAGNLAAGYSAVNAAMTLFGEENEDIQKIMVKVQASMQLVQGLQGLDGLLKRTEGLSRALGLVKKSTVEATTATTAQATATAGQAVATEGATVAQKGLNTAMNANPIGAVILVVTALVGYFVMLKDEIARVIGGTEKMNVVFNKVKVIATGVGNVIRKMLVAPMEALVRIVQGDFEGAVQSIINNYNVINNYQEAAAKKEEELAEETAKKKKEQYIKDKENYIKNEEAKHGSDWKYTKEGKEAYEALFKWKMEMYVKDSDEYLQAQRDMWIYLREYEDRKTKTAKQGSAARTKTVKDEVKEAQKAYSDYMKTSVMKQNEAIQGIIDAWNKANPNDTIFMGLKFEWDYDDNGNLIINKEELEKKLMEDLDDIDLDKVLKKFDLGNSIRKTLFDFQLGNFDYKKLVSGVIEPADTEKLIKEAYEPRLKYLEKESADLNKLLDIYKEDYGESSDIYIKTIKSLEGVETERFNLLMDQTKRISDAYKASYDIQTNAIKSKYEYQKAIAENEELLYESNYNSLWAVTTNSIEILKKRDEYENEQYTQRMNMYKQLEDTYKEMTTNMNLTAEERANAQIELDRLALEKQIETTDYMVADNQRRIDSQKEWMDFTQNSLNALGSILGDVADAWKTSVDAEVDAMEASEEEKDRIRNEEYEKMKGLQSAIAMINAFSSAVSAYNSMASIPYVGPALGAAAAAAALASGIAQVVAINKTKIGDKASGSDNRYAEVTPTQPDFNPTYTANVTGEQETQNLANAINNRPVKAYVVESEVSAKQEMAKQRNNNTTF